MVRLLDGETLCDVCGCEIDRFCTSWGGGRENPCTIRSVAVFMTGAFAGEGRYEEETEVALVQFFVLAFCAPFSLSEIPPLSRPWFGRYILIKLRTGRKREKKDRAGNDRHETIVWSLW